MAERNMCCDCAYFEYDEIWDGEEETEIYICKKEHYEHISFYADACEDWSDDNEAN